MSKYDYILFDLDGTLTDSAEGIINSIEYALEKLGVTVADRNELRKFVGPPFKWAIMEFLGFDERKATETLNIYRERYSTIGLFENEVYPGIPELLASLRSEGVKLAVATSKPEVYSVRILEHYGLDEYFDTIAGCGLDGTHVNKAEVIADALERLDCKDFSRVVMIGDRKYDVEGAKENDLPCIGVLYGYGGREELQSAGAIKIAASVDELAAML